MGIDRQEVMRIAELARLEVSSTEADRYVLELGSILEYAAQLAGVDTEGREPLSHALELVNVMREDLPTAGLTQQEALMNAPSRKGEFFLVPRIMDNSDGE
jgi:aspartyl-tRNA(Asn)/glutamyl-tRNA(Gln) amidotransferase subunit C